MTNLSNTIEQPPGPVRALSGGPDTETPKKVFAKKFRLVFNKTDDQSTTWIEVESLTGLKRVIERVSKGELTPINANATLNLQLWGHLAEYVGFMRVESRGEFTTGIVPLGEEQGALANDMTELFGGAGPAFEALTEMRNQLAKELDARQPVEPTHIVSNKILKSDGVNFTPEGEDALIKLFQETDRRPFIGTPSEPADANTLFRKRADNASVIADQTETPSAVDNVDEMIQANRPDEELQTFTGPEAEEIGKKVEDAARRDSREEE